MGGEFVIGLSLKVTSFVDVVTFMVKKVE